jgi:hypothetical protein
VVAGILAGCGSEETRQDSEAGEVTGSEEGWQATQPVARNGADAEAGGSTEVTAGPATETTAREAPDRLRCSEEERTTNVERGEVRIGAFEPPEEAVPAYEILEERPAERDGAKATRLLIDTRARSEEDHTLIVRDLKSKYSELDAVGIEFTDTTGSFSYNGGATIFNTPCGSDYLGYILRPPNNEGYQVIVARDLDSPR